MINNRLEAAVADMAARVHEQISAATASHVLAAYKPILSTEKIREMMCVKIPNPTEHATQNIRMYRIRQ
ncbi:hypothetical protein BSP99_15100 [Corynebacterium glutamicum]|uniref:hypothetical protein n=1 Tax=Corynebacterium glutamicum TaxID=1718 RepID=UPI00094A4FB7|nr:hypothetical protein [Corynebacterium glutamicum]APT08630.1 hypothetical protein BSP99_15100 [Corynebacterium glutamicum]